MKKIIIAWCFLLASGLNAAVETIGEKDLVLKEAETKTIAVKRYYNGRDLTTGQYVGSEPNYSIAADEKLFYWLNDIDNCGKELISTGS